MMLESLSESRVEQCNSHENAAHDCNREPSLKQCLTPKVHGGYFCDAEQQQCVTGETVAVFLNHVGKQNDAQSFETPRGRDPFGFIFSANIVAIKITGTKNWSCSGRATSAVVIFFQRLALAGGAYRPRKANAK